ncbi:MAG TPA: helix-turn-helix transcriptional regulator [Cyclobacteriaceae bacterium]|nr:helix-turn-helix transcriptional regulator [Cyclobacteriaceae bacterium]
MKTFGETIREARESKGLLLREVAAALKVDLSFVSRIEKGTKRPTREQVVQLGSILKVNTEELLVLYLSERMVYQLRDEEFAIEAIMAAEKAIRYRAMKNPKKKRQGRGG